MRGLAILVCCAVQLGCAAAVEDEGCEDMSRTIVDGQRNRIEHWGSSVVLKAPWRENDTRPVLFKPPYKDPASGRYCVPVSQSLLLSSSVTGDRVGANYAFRWQLKVGGGGGAAAVKFDMLNTQQIAIAGENINVEVVCERFNVDPATPFALGVANDQVVTASVSMADGNVSSGQATYTQYFALADGANIVLPIPQMATSYRIIGSTLSTPFVAGFVISMGFGTHTQGYDGTQLPVFTTSFNPLLGGVTGARLQNTSGGAVQGWLQWGLDL